MIMRNFRYIITLVSACALLLGWSCSKSSSLDLDDIVIEIKGSQTEISYDYIGGKNTFEMYTNLPEWKLQPEYEEDWQWVQAFPKEGVGDARFSIKVFQNERANPRSCDMHIVSRGVKVATISLYQTGAEPSLQLKYSSPEKIVSSIASSFKIKVTANLDWDAVIPAGVSWLSVKEKSDEWVVFETEDNGEPMDRTTVVSFEAIGTKLHRSLKITQTKQSESFKTARLVSIAELKQLLGTEEGTIQDNVYIEAYVVSDKANGNFNPSQAVLMDESGAGLCLEFDDEDSNDYELGTKLTVHMMGLTSAKEAVSGAPRFIDVNTSVVMKSEESAGIAPIEIDDVSLIGDYEYSLVTLKNMEFVVPWGTYFNMVEDYASGPENYYFSGATCYHIDSPDYAMSAMLQRLNEFRYEYVQPMRDLSGNIIELYTYYTFTGRHVRMIPDGSGDITGVVFRREKGSALKWNIHMRKAEDDRISDDPTTRHSRTVMQLGPWIEYKNGLNKVLASVGTGQLRESATPDAVKPSNTAGNAFMFFTTGCARCKPAVLVNGAWSPIYSGRDAEVSYQCIGAQDWWDNNYNRIEDAEGVAWLIQASTVGATGQLSLDFTCSGSSSGPVYFVAEWSTDENAKLGEWHQFAEYYVANYTATYTLKAYTIDLPKECNDRSDLIIRLRNNGTQTTKCNSSTIGSSGNNKLGFIRISER